MTHEPIVPPYLVLRAKVRVVFARYIAEAERAQDSPRMAILEALQHEVIEQLELTPEPEGGDSRS